MIHLLSILESTLQQSSRGVCHQLSSMAAQVYGLSSSAIGPMPTSLPFPMAPLSQPLPYFIWTVFFPKHVPSGSTSAESYSVPPNTVSLCTQSMGFGLNMFMGLPSLSSLICTVNVTTFVTTILTIMDDYLFWHTQLPGLSSSINFMACLMVLLPSQYIRCSPHKVRPTRIPLIAIGFELTKSSMLGSLL